MAYIPISGGTRQRGQDDPCATITIREWFAGMALQGMLHPDFVSRLSPDPSNTSRIAEKCFELADAMATLACNKEAT